MIRNERISGGRSFQETLCSDEYGLFRELEMSNGQGS